MDLTTQLRDQARRHETTVPTIPGISAPDVVLAQGDDGPLLLTTDMHLDAVRIDEAALMETAFSRTAMTGTHHRKARLDQITFAIDYRDAGGVPTRRPVTIISIHAEGGNPTMEAYCHMRDANRSFRIDRINYIITVDGEMILPAKYFLDIFAIDLRVFASATKADDPLAGARKVRDALRPMLSLLVLAARADGHYHVEELDVILRYAEAELLQMERAGSLVTPITIPMLDQLTSVVRQMRPTTEPLDYYLSRVASLNDAGRKRFGRALHDVIAADGVWTDDELEFLTLLETRGLN